MDRLTIKAPSGLIHLIDDTEYGMCKAVNLLSAYEDTGLDPEEINSLNTFDGSQGVKYLKLYQEEQRKHSWIPVSERLPEDGEYDNYTDGGMKYLKRLEVAYMTDTIEYMIGYYNGYAWIDKRYNNIVNVVAWKRHEPYSPQI